MIGVSKRFIWSFVVFSALVLATAFGVWRWMNRTDVTLTSEHQRLSYAVGHQYAGNLKSQNLQVDAKAFMEGFLNVLQDRPLRLTKAQMDEALQTYLVRKRETELSTAKVNSAAGLAFLRAYAAKPGVHVTASGLHYRELKAGTGIAPQLSSTVVVHYKGMKTDGTVFDSSGDGAPVRLPLRSVIPGWAEAMQMMPVGAKWELVIPSELGYGTSPHPKIAPGSVLVFEVELLGVE